MAPMTSAEIEEELKRLIEDPWEKFRRLLIEEPLKSKEEFDQALRWLLTIGAGIARNQRWIYNTQVNMLSPLQRKLNSDVRKILEDKIIPSVNELLEVLRSANKIDLFLAPLVRRISGLYREIREGLPAQESRSKLDLIFQDLCGRSAKPLEVEILLGDRKYTKARGTNVRWSSEEARSRVGQLFGISRSSQYNYRIKSKREARIEQNENSGPSLEDLFRGGLDETLGLMNEERELNGNKLPVWELEYVLQTLMQLPGGVVQSTVEFVESQVKGIKTNGQ